MIPRILKEKLVYFSTKYPVVTLTGPRQSGKTTLLQNSFPGYSYVSLEEPDMRLQAINDPRTFLKNFSDKTIIDEIQYAPELFSYIQTRVDAVNQPGMYIISGSQNFLLLEKISQSLAGRTAILHLFPLNFGELKYDNLLPDDSDKAILNGFYPALFTRSLKPDEFYPFYIQTYLERDVRQIKNIGDHNLFVKFIKLCAGRVGQVLNLSSLANECGITQPTAQSWLSILEAGFIAFRLPPYFHNFNKRIVKSPKLYFYDTGLVCSLLSVNSEKQVATYYNRGALFENLIIAELIKQFHHHSKTPSFYYWKDNSENEVDLLIDYNGKTKAIEIKSGATMNEDFFKNLVFWQKITGSAKDDIMVIYGGDRDFETRHGKLEAWNNLNFSFLEDV